MMQIRKNIRGKIQKIAGGAQRRGLVLQEMLSSYGIGVDDVKAKASQLENVLRELKSREFMNAPAIQKLMSRVRKKKAVKVEAKSSKPKKKSKLSRLKASRLGYMSDR